MSQAVLIQQSVEALGRELVRISNALRTSPIVLFMIVFGGESEGTMNFAAAYLNQSGVVISIPPGPRVIEPLLKIQEALLSQQNSIKWVTFEMTIDQSGGVDVEIVYPDQTTINYEDYWDRSMLDVIMEKHFPGMPSDFSSLLA
jgi:hypothetical protein